MEPVFPFALDLPAPGQGLVREVLHRRLREAIVDGRLAAGQPLPATRRVAAALGVARNTVVGAYDLLVAEGYALPRRGATALVADIAGRRPRPPRLQAGGRFNPAWTHALLQPEPPQDLPARCFRLGIPEHRHFPHGLWRRLSARAQREWSRNGFRYPPSQGLPVLREAIARHVAFARAVACSGGDVVVTSGAQQAFDLLARLLVTSGRTRVAIEEPGYPPVRAPFVAAGAQLVPVPVDGEGLCVDRLPDDVRVISVTPSHQSPTGVAMSLRRRRALLQFARAHDAVIIEDDYDGEFRFGGRPLDALQTLDRDGRVFYVGTFSKSLFPALRKGFVVAPPWAREALVAIRHCTDSHSDEVAQAALAAFIGEGHLVRYVRRMRRIYAARRRVLLEALGGGLAPWFEPIPCEAGLHLAAYIRDPAQAPAVFELARRHAPGAQSIAEYSMTAPERPGLAFGYGVIDAEEIAAALAGFSRALRT